MFMSQEYGKFEHDCNVDLEAKEIASRWLNMCTGEHLLYAGYCTDGRIWFVIENKFAHLYYFGSFSLDDADSENELATRGSYVRRDVCCSLDDAAYRVRFL